MIVLTASPPQRRGLTSVAVLVCLIIITMISGAVIRVGLAPRDEVRAEERSLQAEWLAEAGIQRALARLAVDPAYTGETWDIPARELDSANAALVTITVGPAPASRNDESSAPGPIIPATCLTGRGTPRSRFFRVRANRSRNPVSNERTGVVS